MSSVTEATRADYLQQAKVSRLALAGEHLDYFSPRGTSVYAASKPLPLAGRPVTGPLAGGSIVVEASLPGFSAGRAVAVRGRSAGRPSTVDETEVVVVSRLEPAGSGTRLILATDLAGVRPGDRVGERQRRARHPRRQPEGGARQRRCGGAVPDLPAQPGAADVRGGQYRHRFGVHPAGPGRPGALARGAVAVRAAGERPGVRHPAGRGRHRDGRLRRRPDRCPAADRAGQRAGHLPGRHGPGRAGGERADQLADVPAARRAGRGLPGALDGADDPESLERARTDAPKTCSPSAGSSRCAITRTSPGPSEGWARLPRSCCGTASAGWCT